MAQPYVGEIRMFAGNFAPAGWMFCEGQLLPISENETLFQLIGTTYGGDGQSTFALPDLRGRIPIHQGNGGILAETCWRMPEEITLTVKPDPRTHAPDAGLHDAGLVGQTDPGQRGGAQSRTAPSTSTWRTTLELCRRTRSRWVGGSQPHTNFAAVPVRDFIISLFGIFPSPT
jgi:microcystin-dependent protein